MSAIFEDPALAKTFAMVLIGIIVVLAAAVIVLAWKKNQIIYVERDTLSGNDPALSAVQNTKVIPAEVNEPIEEQPDDFSLSAEDIIPAQNTEAVPLVDLPVMGRHSEKTEQPGVTVGAEVDISVGGKTVHTTLRDFPCLMGREASVCDVVISEPAVSRRHAEFLLENGSLYIEDVSEHNGTYLNETKLPPLGKAKVQGGDVITLGRARITVRSLITE